VAWAEAAAEGRAAIVGARLAMTPWAAGEAVDCASQQVVATQEVMPAYAARGAGAAEGMQQVAEGAGVATQVAGEKQA